jgi:hypothetical protein
MENFDKTHKNLFNKKLYIFKFSNNGFKFKPHVRLELIDPT